MARRLLILMGLLCLTGSLAFAQSLTERPHKRFAFPPRDDAGRIPGLKSFRDRLLRAVKARDAQSVMAAVLPTVRARFENSLAIPRKQMAGKDHQDWQHLERLLTLGGGLTTTRGAVKGRTEFCAPYIYTDYPKPEPVEFQYEGHPWAVIADRVVVRAKPNGSSAALGYLSYELVKGEFDLSPPTKPAQRFGVIMPDGREGWVLRELLRDPEDYHACFAEFDSHWKMTEFSRGMPHDK
jgi:hypothetical protein